MFNGHDLKRARSALLAIDPDCNREQWVDAGMAAKAAGLSFEDFDGWSAQSPKYSERDARTTWNSFSANGGIGPGTLYYLASDAGWREGAGQNRTGNANRSPQEPLKAPPKGMSAAEIWDRLEPATSSHLYVVGKQAEGVPLDRLRVVPTDDPLRIAGQSVAGWLAVPMMPLEGGPPSSLQFIPPPGAGKKLNLPGHGVSGAFIVGDLTPGGEVFLTEGIGTAWAAWRATGKPAVVTFGAGRMRSVAQSLRQRDPDARLVLVPDVGKEQAAFEIAAEVGANVAALPPGWPQNSDVADFAQKEGIEGLVQLLEAAKPPVPPALPFALVSIADLEAQEPPALEFVWDKLLPADTVTLLAAHGGTGKSFVALMLCVAVALGLPMFGLGTRQGKAAFFSGEDGAAMLRYRLWLVCRSMGVQVRDLNGRLFIIDATEYDPRLYVEASGPRGGDVTETFEALRGFVHGEGISLVVLDNASDTFDAPEIDRARVRAFMRALTVLARQANAGVLLLAHVDKGTSRGERGPNSEGYSGSTAWHNSARSRLFMHRDKDGALLLEHQKGNLSAGLVPKTRLEWQKNDVPRLGAADPVTEQGESVDQQASGAGKALLRLIDEFTRRGEWISSATNSRTHAEKLLSKEPTYPNMKRADVFNVLRSEQRAGHLTVITYSGLDRKKRQRWAVTPEGKVYAGIAASAASAAGAEHTAPSAPDAEPAASAASALQGVWGKERAHEPAAETC